MQRTSSPRSTLNTILGVVILAVMLFPIYWMLNLSVQSSGSSLASSFFPTEFHLDGYVSALRDQTGNLFTSLIVSLSTVALTLFIAVPAAYALAQFPLKGVNAVLLTLAITQMIPGIVLANSLYRAYNDLGALNTIIGLVFADATHSIPFAILLVRTSMMSVPPRSWRPRAWTAPTWFVLSAQLRFRLLVMGSSPLGCSLFCSRGEISSSP